MSNLIKYPFVNLEGKETIIIDSEHQHESFVPFYEQEEEPEIQEPETQEAMELESAATMDTQVLEQLQENARLEAKHILEDARAQSDYLIESATQDSTAIREKARLEGYHEGYAAGEIESRQRYDQLEQELQLKIEDQQKEYDQLMAEIEPRYVEVLISLIQKLTGILLEDHSDVILYLIKNSLNNLDKSSHYTIRSSTEDSAFMDSHRNEIKDFVGEDCSVEFIEEKSLKHNQCIIETDNQMIDCGFKTQLDSMIETLKMLVV